MAVLALAVAVRLYLIAAVPPASDVFYYDAQAVGFLLRGMSPYGQPYSIQAPLSTPGAQDVFAYLPFTALYLVPFQVLGDVRLGSVVADAVIGLCIFQFRGRLSLAASAFYLLVPFTIILSTFYVNNALFGVAFLAVSVALEYKGQGVAAALALGLALATSLLVWLFFPFYLYYRLRQRRWKEPLIAVLLPAAISLPFAVSSPGAFLYDVLLFQFQRPATALVASGGLFGFGLNLSLSALWAAATGEALPLSLRVALALVLLAALLYRADGLASSLLRSSLFTALALFVVPSDLFFAYLALPLVLFLLWLSQVPGGVGRPTNKT